MCCIVLDLEWNQPFSMRSMITTPVRLHGEIIQIGAVKLNEQLEIVDTFKVMVKPKYYPYMHRKISRLTQISNADLAYGVLHCLVPRGRGVSDLGKRRLQGSALEYIRS